MQELNRTPQEYIVANATSGGSVQGRCSWQRIKVGSFIEDVRSKHALLGRQTEFTEAVGAPGQVVPKRPPGLSVSPISRSEIKPLCER